MRIRIVLLLAIVSLFSLSGVAQPSGFDLSNYGVRVEPDKRLIAVLAALEVAELRLANGETVRAFRTTLSPAGEKFRARLMADNAGVPADLKQRISTFVSQYKKQRPNATDAELLTPFVSMAYTLGPAPDLSDPTNTTDLPGSLLDVLDFAPLVREFFRKSALSANIDEYVRLYKTESDGMLRTSARAMVSALLDYLHTRPETVFIERKKVQTQKAGSKNSLEKVEEVARERRFFIVPEMLIPTDSVVFLNIKDDYHVIVPPNKNLTSSDARRAFLQFVIDPLVLKQGKDVALVREAIKPIAEERRKAGATVSADAFLVISRSLIAAIDARQEEYMKGAIALDEARRKIDTMKTDDERRAVSAGLDRFRKELADETALRLAEDYEKGAILSFYFAEALRGVEESGFDIASSLREMLASFDPAKEKGRLEAVADARKRALAAREARRSTTQAAPKIENPVTARLIEISRTIEAKDFRRAHADLKELLEKNPGDARIYYNLGRVASLSAEAEEDPETQAQKLVEAKAAYSNVISHRNASTDPALLSQTFVNLARIYAHLGDRDYALKLYDEAIKIGEVPDGAFSTAIAGKQRLLKP
jgi:hypothetical protein